MNRQDTFYTFAATARNINTIRGTNAKISCCAAYFRAFKNPKILKLAAQFLGEGAFPNISSYQAGIGSRTVSTCAAEFCDIDYEKVFKPCRYATGSASEAIEKLMQHTEMGRSNRSSQPIGLPDIQQTYHTIRKARTRKDKQQLLRETWQSMTPVEIKYFIRVMSRGSLRIGFEERSVVSALAEAFEQPLEKVRYAHMICGSIGKTAVLCYHNKIGDAEFTMYQPLTFMLASPVEWHTLTSIDTYIAEEKFDGMRCQLHMGPDQVKLFSRDLNDINRSFPDLCKTLLNKNIPETVLDGEICVFKDDRIQPFQLLQKRMGVKKPDRSLLDKYPVVFVAFDLLYSQNKPLFDRPLTDRRQKLEALCSRFNIPYTRQFTVTGREDVVKLFELALEHGNEGLMLKKKKSIYEYGQRRKSWLKVKKPGGSLDTVIMYAHTGSGKRGGYYSDFTLGIRVAEDDRYEEEFIPIGKAYGGYTDDEMKQLNKKIKNITAEKYGPTLGLFPEIVVELEFDDIQVNKRTKANYTLRFPRFKAIRWDLGPKDVDTLKNVEQLYEQKLNKQRLPQSKNPSIIAPVMEHINTSKT